MSLFNICYGILRPYQKDIVDAAIKKPKNAIVLDVGFGKTLVAICLSLYHWEKTGTPALFICSKGLIINVYEQINEFFGDKLKYQILQTDYIKARPFSLDPDTAIVITTPDFTMSAYKKKDIDKHLIKVTANRVDNSIKGKSTNYIVPDTPYLEPEDNDPAQIIYSTKWSYVVVDEAQDYNNISTQKCRSIIAICSPNRSLLSGTIINEPVPERIFGMYMLIHATQLTSNQKFKEYMKSNAFKGYKEICIIPSEDKMDKLDISYKHNIIKHTLNQTEKDIYSIFKSVVFNVNDALTKAKLDDESEIDASTQKIFNAEILAIITELRKSTLAPILSLSHLYRSIESKDTHLSEIYRHEMAHRDFDEYINDPGSLRSSRVNAILDVLQKHSDERIIVFSSFSSFLKMFKELIPDRPSLALSSDMKTEDRADSLDSWRSSDNGVLLMTYKLGGAGLNLQDGRIVVLADFWWNDGTTKQAIGRVVRKGQTKDCIIYSFTSGTGIEEGIGMKHDDKTELINDLFDGSSNKVVRTMKISEIIEVL